MKTKTNIIYPAFALCALAFFWLPRLTHAQCPQICDGNDNTALGDNALLNNTGLANTAIGSNALNANPGGGDNTATGAFALYQNTSEFNTANGAFALYNNTSGAFNTAVGMLPSTTT